MTEHSAMGLIGASVRRVEDAVLVTGKGCYVDDLQFPGLLHMAFLRTPYPHAKLVSVNTAVAKAVHGVITVVSGDDIAGLEIPAAPMAAGQKIPPHPVLARGAVHAAGVPVAAVVAQSRAIAQDAANAIEAEYDPLPAVTARTARRLAPAALGPARWGSRPRESWRGDPP